LKSRDDLKGLGLITISPFAVMIVKLRTEQS